MATFIICFIAGYLVARWNYKAGYRQGQKDYPQGIHKHQ